MKVSKAKIVFFGALVGVINGFFGGGGGMIVVPMLTKMFKMEQKKAQATAIFVILPISVVSAIIYLCHRSISLVSGLPVILSIIVGGVLGATLLNKLNNKVVRAIFIFMMAFGGVAMLIWG